MRLWYFKPYWWSQRKSRMLISVSRDGSTMLPAIFSFLQICTRFIIIGSSHLRTAIMEVFFLSGTACWALSCDSSQRIFVMDLTGTIRMNMMRISRCWWKNRFRSWIRSFFTTKEQRTCRATKSFLCLCLRQIFRVRSQHRSMQWCALWPYVHFVSLWWKNFRLQQPPRFIKVFRRINFHTHIIYDGHF